MSLRVDTSSLISGALVCGNRGLGVLGSDIPSTGDNGAGYLYNDLSLPSDAGKEVRGLIVTPPSSGEFFAYEDSSFEFAAPDGEYSFTYRLYVDGIDLGTATASLFVGSVPVTITCNLGTATASGYQATIQVSGNTTIACSLGTATASGFQATIIGGTYPTIGRPTSDVSNSGWTPSSGSDLYAMLDEETPSDADYISTTTLGANCKLALNATQYPGTASQTLQLRASSSTGNNLSVTIKDGATTIATRSLTLSPTFDLHTITLSAGEIALISTGILTVEMTSI